MTESDLNAVMAAISAALGADADANAHMQAYRVEQAAAMNKPFDIPGLVVTIGAVETGESPLPADTVVPSRFDVVTGTAPSYWASYFINGDDSGMDESEIEQADAFAAWLGGNIVSCEDAGFYHRHDATQFGALASDCQTYTALIARESVQ